MRDSLHIAPLDDRQRRREDNWITAGLIAIGITVIVGAYVLGQINPPFHAGDKPQSEDVKKAWVDAR